MPEQELRLGSNCAVSCITSQCVWETETAPLWTSCSIHLQLGLGAVIYGQDLYWEYFYSSLIAAGVNGNRQKRKEKSNSQPSETSSEETNKQGGGSIVWHLRDILCEISYHAAKIWHENKATICQNAAEAYTAFVL